jgi:probable F420-dependent oxidoreductase
VDEGLTPALPAPAGVRIGIALAAQAPGATGPELIAAARRADARGFASVWILDRLVYDSHAIVPLLGMLAGVTRAARLGTAILLAQLRSPVLLAKELATVDALSGGRLIAGLGIGGREVDFDAAQVRFARRGRRMEECLDVIELAWSGRAIRYSGELYEYDLPPVGPRPTQSPRPPVWLGGRSDPALARAVRRADGYVFGRSGPSALRGQLQRAERALQETGRDPATLALANVCFLALGDSRKEALARLSAYHGGYYGDARLDLERDAVFGGPDDAAARLCEFAAVGAGGAVRLTELICVPVTVDPEQVDMLADVVTALGGGQAAVTASRGTSSRSRSV